MPVDPNTLQQFAQTRVGTSYQAPAPYQGYKAPEVQQLPDATQPLTQRREELKGLMNDPLSDPRYKAYSDAVNQSGAAQRQAAHERLRNAADPLAVARELEKYDMQTRSLLANRLGDLFGQQQEELGSLATAESGVLDSAAQRAQQQNQFGAQLQEQSGQFGYGQGAQQGQFGATLANQQDQFGRTLENQQDQFGRTLGENQRQFDTNTATREREFNAQMQERQRQFDRTADLQEDRQSIGHTVAESFFGGAGRAAGSAFGGWVGGMLGDMSAGGGYSIPDSWQGVPYAKPQLQSTPNALERLYDWIF